MKTFWISFCNPCKPQGKQFLGVLIMQDISFEHAVRKALKLKINPGGECKGWEIEKDSINPDHFNKLLSKQQLAEYGYI